LRTFYPLFIVICISNAMFLCRDKTKGKLSLIAFFSGIGITYIMNFIYLL